MPVAVAMARLMAFIRLQPDTDHGIGQRVCRGRKDRREASRKGKLLEDREYPFKTWIWAVRRR